MEIPTTGECANCSKPAKRRCTSCVEGLVADGNPSPTFYCSVECQNVDWAKHKVTCRHADARKTLYRGAELLQATFYIVREVAFDFEFTEVIKTEDGKLHIYDTWTKAGEGPLYRFPEHLVDDTENKKTILCYAACGDPLIYFHNIHTTIFSGIYVSPQ